MGFSSGVNCSFVCFRILRFCERHIRAFFNLVIILLVLAAVVLVSNYAFKCPCLVSGDLQTVPTTRVVYGSLFIGVPALILWLAGILMHETTWRCITGWRVQHKFAFTGRSCGCFWYTLVASSLTPLSWLIFVFLNGSYFECVVSNVPDSCDGSVTPSPNQADQNLNHRVLSQMIACAIAGGAFILFFMVYLCSQCCSSMTYYQKKLGREIATLEDESFDDAFKEYYNEEFKAKWKAMFNEGRHEDWQWVSELVPSNPKTRAKKTFYSPFHMWRFGEIAPFPRSQPVPDKMLTVTIKSGGEWEVSKSAHGAKLDTAQTRQKMNGKTPRDEKHSSNPIASQAHLASQNPVNPMMTTPLQPGHLPPLAYPKQQQYYNDQQMHYNTSLNIQQQKQQGLYTPRQPPIPTPQPMSDDPDDEVPIATAPKKSKKKIKRKKVKKSQVVDSVELGEAEA